MEGPTWVGDLSAESRSSVLDSEGQIWMEWATTARLRLARMEAMLRENEGAGDTGVEGGATRSRCTCPNPFVAVRRLGKPIVFLCTKYCPTD